MVISGVQMTTKAAYCQYDLRVKGQGQINMKICFKACDANSYYLAARCKVFIFGKVVSCGVYRTMKLSDR